MTAEILDFRIREVSNKVIEVKLKIGDTTHDLGFSNTQEQKDLSESLLNAHLKLEEILNKNSVPIEII